MFTVCYVKWQVTVALDEVPKKVRIFSKLVLEKIGAFFLEPNFVKRLVARSPWASAARGRVRLKFGQAPLLTRFGRKIREFGLQSQTKRLSSVGCVSTDRAWRSRRYSVVRQPRTCGENSSIVKKYAMLYICVRQAGTGVQKR